MVGRQQYSYHMTSGYVQSFDEAKHTHAASYRTIMFEWLVGVATRVCFTDRHEMDAPPETNTKLVYDLALCGLDI